MDYIDTLNNQIQEEYEIIDEMERLGIENYEEYINYISDLEAEAQIRNYEALQER